MVVEQAITKPFKTGGLTSPAWICLVAGFLLALLLFAVVAGPLVVLGYIGLWWLGRHDQFFLQSHIYWSLVPKRFFMVQSKPLQVFK